MRKTMLLILALPLCIALIMSVFAKPARMTLTGEVVQVDEMAQTISVKDSVRIEVFDIADAIFTEEYDIETVQPGDVVEIAYEKREGTWKAVAVTLKIGILEPENPPYALDESRETGPIQSPVQSL